jgi:hypothetical protein
MQSRQSLERPTFWQRGISRPQLHCAMRKSRQPRCTPAISTATSSDRAEAAGRMPKSELRDFVHVIIEPAAPIMRATRMARS